MQRRNAEKDASGVEASGVLLELTDILQVEEQLAARTVIQHQKELFLALEGIIETHYERVVHALQNAALCLGVLYLVALL